MFINSLLTAISLGNIVNTSMIPMVGMLFLLYFVITNPLLTKEQTKLFFSAVLIVITMVIILAADYIFSQIKDAPFGYMCRRVTSFLNFAMSPAMTLIFYRIYSKKKLKFLEFLPFILNFLICFSSIFVKTVFMIGKDNSYARGPLFFVPLTITGVYAIMLLFSQQRLKTKSARSELYFMILFLAAVTLSLAFEIAEGLKMLSWNMVAILIIIYYLLLTVNRHIIDNLTGAYSRSKYIKDIAKIANKKSRIIAMIDMNYLKSINDSYGHEQGDKCLILLSNILQNQFGLHGVIYRIGGDEFVCISSYKTVEQFEEAMGKAFAIAQKSNISFACGYLQYNADMDINETINMADELMYINKRNIKDEDLIAKKVKESEILN